MWSSARPLGAHPGTDVRRGAWQVDRLAIRPHEIPSATRSRTPLGVPRLMWGRQPGVFASLDPRLISVTPIGVGLSQAISGLKTTSRVKGPLCPPLGVHPNTHRGLGPTPASREPGPPCPAAGCPSGNRRTLGCMATWIGGPFDRAKFHRPRVHAPLQGADRSWGTGTGGVASLNPRLISVTPTGVGLLSLPGGDQQTPHRKKPSPLGPVVNPPRTAGGRCVLPPGTLHTRRLTV